MFANLTVIHRRAIAAILQRGGTDFRIYNSIVNVNPVQACVQMANPFTINPPDPSLDKVGPPVYRSTFFSCGATTAAAGAGITVDQITAILNGTNTTPPTETRNVLNGTSTLTGTWFPGANELAVQTTPVAGINPYLTNTSYIGAFASASDTWYNGWACGLGGSTPACEVAPRPIAN
jgi:hypothetical protein